MYALQWRIQDFPEGGREPSRGAWTRQIFPKTAWNRKNLDAQGGRASLTPPLDPPMLYCNTEMHIAVKNGI